MIELYKVVTCKQVSDVTLKFNITIPLALNRGNIYKIRRPCDPTGLVSGHKYFVSIRMFIHQHPCPLVASSHSTACALQSTQTLFVSDISCNSKPGLLLV